MACLADAASAQGLARLVESFPRRVRGGTGIGEAVAFSARQFDKNGLTGTRRVIDLSGDGSETTARDFVITPNLARVFALNRGIAINALAIRAKLIREIEYRPNMSKTIEPDRSPAQAAQLTKASSSNSRGARP